MYVPHFIYVFIFQWPVGLLLSLGCCEWLYKYHLMTQLSFFWVYTQKGIARSYGDSIFNFLRNCHTVMKKCQFSMEIMMTEELIV